MRLKYDHRMREIIGPPPPRSIVCARCHTQVRIAKRFNPPRYCRDCRDISKVEAGAAQSRVNRAIRSGKLLHPTELDCVDCGQPADRYDHRSYSRPLDVSPVCGPCNYKRGPAHWAQNTHTQLPQLSARLSPESVSAPPTQSEKSVGERP